MLKLFFKSVSVASDGVEAFELYKKNRYDLVITDLTMPNMDGVELSQKIKNFNHDQVIIVLSGYIDTYVIELIDIGISSLVLKPFELNKFIQILCKQSENILLEKKFRQQKVEEYIIGRKSLEVKEVEKLDEAKEVKATPIQTSLAQATPLTNLQTPKAVATSGAISASAFNEDEKMWEVIADDITEYNFNLKSIFEYIDLNGVNDSYLYELESIFAKYYTTISLLTGLEQFAYIFESLSSLFRELDINTLNRDLLNEEMEKFSYIYDDIANFFNVVFVLKSAKDINYLTDSLKSTIEQFKRNLGLVEYEDDDELEMF